MRRPAEALCFIDMGYDDSFSAGYSAGVKARSKTIAAEMRRRADEIESPTVEIPKRYLQHRISELNKNDVWAACMAASPSTCAYRFHEMRP